MTYEHKSQGLSPAVEEDCCGTACPVQPRFFHGQLLTDADLNQLLSWAESKFRLQRARDGWGVVCGLELSLDPKHPTHVIIQPGQAIDCCGRDLVVCEPISFDLSDACPKEECLEPTYNRWGRTSRDEKKKDSDYEKPPLNPSSPTDLFRSSQALDLFLHYSTEGSDSQVGLGRGRAGQGSECEYSRLKETVTVTWEPAGEAWETERQHSKDLDEGYRDLRNANVARIHQARAKADSPESLKSWFLERLDAHPLHQFGFVREWINAIEPGNLANYAARILFFMDMEEFLAWGRCGCPGCSSDTGVRVGGAWLQGPDQSDDNCRIIWVSDQPPYRRELRSGSCDSVLPGCTNLAPYLWQDWNAAFQSLSNRRVTIMGSNEILFDDLNWDALESIYAPQGQITSCNEAGAPLPLRATIVNLGPPFGTRAVSFHL